MHLYMSNWIILSHLDILIIKQADVPISSVKPSFIQRFTSKLTWLNDKVAIIRLE